MRAKATCDLPARLQRIRRRFARWRQTRQGYARIPAGLWILAVQAPASTDFTPPLPKNARDGFPLLRK